MKAAPQDCRLELSDAFKEMKNTLLEINNHYTYTEHLLGEMVTDCTIPGDSLSN